MSNKWTAEKKAAFLSELTANELTQIKLSQYIIHFIFVEGSSITVESGFQHIDKEGNILSNFEVYGEEKIVTVHRLLGTKIANINSDDDENVLQIKFDQGDILKIFRDPNLSESYAIYLNGSHHVV